MATEKQIKANKENSKKSTGAISAQGKQTVSKNAITHGLLSNRLLLDNESAKDWQSLVDGLNQSINPDGYLESLLTEKVAISFWRQRRLVMAEAAKITYDRLEAIACIDDTIDSTTRMFYLAEDIIRKKIQVFEQQAEVAKNIIAPFNNDLIPRYSASLDNELYKALAALREHQGRRLTK